MTAMHPDSGVPWTDARNSIPDTVEASVGCNELWYSTSRCQPRFDPAAANAVLAELINLINKGEVTYNCAFLNQVETSVRYLIQRGLPRSVYMSGGPIAYGGALDPPLTRYNNYLTITAVPAVNNSGPVTFDAGPGPLPIYTNKNTLLERDDLVAGIPIILVQLNGVWYHIGFVSSQMPPELLTGQVDGWVRTDGSDVTGDGTANTPEKAFLTIQGAYDAIGRRYFPSPELQINIRLGIPGRYPGAIIGPYAGNVVLWGHEGVPTPYEVGPCFRGGVTGGCLLADAVSFNIYGCNLVGDAASGNWANLRVVRGARTNFRNCRFETRLSLPGLFCNVEDGGSLGWYGNTDFMGYGNTLVMAMAVSGGRILGCNIPTAFLNFNNVVFSNAGISSTNLGYFAAAGTTITQTCLGPKHYVSDNSIIRAAGQNLPGNTPGVNVENGVYTA